MPSMISLKKYIITLIPRLQQARPDTPFPMDIQTTLHLLSIIVYLIIRTTCVSVSFCFIFFRHSLAYFLLFSKIKTPLYVYFAAAYRRKAKNAHLPFINLNGCPLLLSKTCRNHTALQAADTWSTESSHKCSILYPASPPLR